MLKNDMHHEKMLIEGLNYLNSEVIDINKIIMLFSMEICSKMVEALGKDKIKNEFKKSDYQDLDFIKHLSYNLEFGVPKFMIQNKLYDKLINTNKLLPVTTALNFCIATNIASVFNKIGLRNSETACVYSNEALLEIVNRTMTRFNDLDAVKLTFLYENLI